MIRAVAVEKLPEGLSFPGDLEPKIHYDAGRHQLAFEGFMSKATFDRLYRLADDRDYRRALEELFQVCTFDDSESPRKNGDGHVETSLIRSIFAVSAHSQSHVSTGSEQAGGWPVRGFVLVAVGLACAAILFALALRLFG
jgi:hypothetical protein